LSIYWNFVTAPYAVFGISPVKLFFDNGLSDITIAKGVYPGKGYRVSAGGMPVPKVY
jgi:hypothetical protein